MVWLICYHVLYSNTLTFSLISDIENTSKLFTISKFQNFQKV